MHARIQTYKHLCIHTFIYTYILIDEVALKTDGAVMAIYEDACHMPMALLLDITVSRVNVDGASLKHKAERLGKHFAAHKLCVVTVDGKLIRYKTGDVYTCIHVHI